MYDQTSISSLESRIGFGTMDISVTITPEHISGGSGRIISSFHKLANLVNIYATVDKDFISEANFNLYLAQEKTNATKHVLNKVFDLNSHYVPLTDYSQLILDRPQLFDEAIGLTLAISAIEGMLSTNRHGNEERNAKLAVGNLRMELEGLKDMYGVVQSGGIRRAQYYALKDASEIIFPNKLTVESHPW